MTGNPCSIVDILNLISIPKICLTSINVQKKIVRNPVFKSTDISFLPNDQRF